MGPVAEGIEHKIQLGLAADDGKVRSQVDWRGPATGRPAERFPCHQVVVNRALAGERSIAVGIRKEDPPVAGAGDQNDERIGRPAIAIQVRGGRLSQRDLRDGAAVVGSGGIQRGDPSEAPEPASGDLDRIASRRQGLKRDRTFVGEVPQVQDLRIIG